jgi:hypothetical protein
VKSRTTARFRRAFDALPDEVKSRARRAYRRFQADPFHASLQFKQVHAARPVFSVRIGLAYRALCVKEEDALIWYWIGAHDDYMRLISGREGV